MSANNLRTDGSQPCAQTDPEAWFPEVGTTSNHPVTRLAISLCRDKCPFTIQCLEWALENKPMGIWGGTTETQRRRILQQRRREAQSLVS
jgi:WhiB family transcriptional regulator, redox-sensing transcriptional regulator